VLALLGNLLSAPEWLQRLGVYQHALDPVVEFTAQPSSTLALLAVGTALAGAVAVG